MYKICKAHQQKMHRDIYLALIADLFNTDRSRPHKPFDVAIHQARKGLLPQMNRDPINVNNNNVHYEALGAHQRKYNIGKDTQKILLFVLQEL